jgi:hypothetical protein
MQQKEKKIKEIVIKNRRFLDALEAADKSGKMPKLNKIRRNFTLDEDVFLSFQERCEQEGIPMSRVLEKLMKKYTEEKQ